MEKVITCITCPLGCDITVRGDGEKITHMEGSGCKRGEEYARNEFIHPLRLLTSVVRMEGADALLVPVRSDKPLPQELLLKCMDKIRDISVAAPVLRYDILIPDILGTGVNIVATGEVPK